MKIVDLIEHISTADETGLLRIKPFKNVEYERIKSVVVYKSESIYLDRNGEWLFDHDIWRETGSRSVNFSSLSGAIKYEVKAAFLLTNCTGCFEGGQGIKFDSVCMQISPLLKLAKWLQNYSVTSFFDFNSLPSLQKRNYIIAFITNKLLVNRKVGLHNFKVRFFEENLNYGLFTAETLSIFDEEFSNHKVTELKLNNQLSHTIVPSGILKQIINQCDKKLILAKSVIDTWEATNDKYVTSIRDLAETRIQYQSASPITNKTTLRNYYELFREDFNALDNLKLDVLMYILIYSGMRKEEALSCTTGCAIEHDGKYYVEAVLTKTDVTSIKMKWVVNKDTYDAIQLLERYVIAMHKRASAILENSNIWISDELEHKLRQGLKESLLFGVADTSASIKFTNASLGDLTIYDKKVHGNKDSKFSLHMYQFAMTAQDVDQLESLGCNYKSIKGRNKGKKYVEGEIFRITAHMLRHNFAWFIIANRLGELDDIKHQFKHLASSMTMVYASRGFESADEMIGLFENFEELLIENIAENIAQEAADGTLTGEGGKRLNSGAKSLIFNVTASSGSDTGRTVKQLHFKNLSAYKEFLVQNLKNIRGLPHGYCTAGPACKLKNVGLPSGCVYCPNYMVTEKQRVNWQAMKNFADKKLEQYVQLSPEKQSEFSLMAESWRDTRNAAAVILSGTKSPKVDEVVA
ncbi:MAG: hypothetical protein NWQ54_11670 [Paraglaciecola sp.]|uniref:hypothetical protein n=1 Tax=Paraglaciecola sp. TaxID=1920173 RepID=UPI00273D2275|nr:hypothetical protein [Paraglaciecola sp.]MDP5030397.1 hypothetical protein [Paraglaciecola sp.]MDP5131535.1 hypothetical protein [Paraglaciecola sp.]